MSDQLLVEAKEVIGWFASGLAAIGVAGCGFLWRSIEAVRTGSAAEVKEAKIEIAGRMDREGAAWASRDLRIDGQFTDVWAAIERVETMNRDSSRRIFERLDSITEKLGQMANRDETRADRKDMEARLMEALSAGKP